MFRTNQKVFRTNQLKKGKIMKKETKIISDLRGFKDFKNTNFEDFNTIDFLSVILSLRKEVEYLKEQEEQAFLMGLGENNE